MKHNNSESVLIHANLYLNLSDPFHDKNQI